MNIEQLVAKREDAMKKVRTWWDAEQLAGRHSDHTKAPAWSEYLSAFDALDRALTSADLGSHRPE